MPRKKDQQSNGGEMPLSFQAAPPMINPRMMEQTMANLSRLLSEREWESVDEANAFLQELVASGQLDAMSPAPDTPLEQAQQLIYQAYDTPTKRKRVELARKALEISPDCADAYVLLAEESTRSVKKARLLYEQGVQAGERALGPDVFVHDVGHFWGIVETRPYMRARSGLAQTLWALDERAEAIAHFADMLRLNPGDNQGIRYLLASCLIQIGDDDALGALLAQYDEDASATWMYTRALWLFRREGAGRKANAALRKALNVNPFVPEYLFGLAPLPEELPPYVGFGDETEAIDYVIDGLIHWHETQDALPWMMAQLERVVSSAVPKRRKRT